MMTDLFVAGPWPTPTLLEAAGHHLAAVHHASVALADLPGAFDSSFPAIATAVASVGAHITGPAVALYVGSPSGPFELTVSFPVADPFPGPVEALGATVEAAKFPTGPVMVLTHVGGYDSLPASWDHLMSTLAAEGRTPGPRWGEIYVSEPAPDTDPATLRTDIWVRLA